MDPSTASPTSADVATETNALLTGVGILSFQFFPFALPLLALCIVPLLPLAVAGLLLAGPILLPLWLVRTIKRARSRRQAPPAAASEAVASS